MGRPKSFLEWRELAKDKLDSLSALDREKLAFDAGGLCESERAEHAGWIIGALKQHPLEIVRQATVEARIRVGKATEAEYALVGCPSSPLACDSGQVAG